MSTLWPHLPDVAAEPILDALRAGAAPRPGHEHAAQLWSAVGGRVKPSLIQKTASELEVLAEEHGFPRGPRSDASKVAFDRAAAQVLRKRMDLDWSEAGKKGLWTFTSLVMLPHLTLWRFDLGNRERWIASDITRHTWARLWWQAVVFQGHEGLLDLLGESDLNQLLERRSIGGDPRLVCAVSEAVVAAPPHLPRRFVMRDVTRRLRRWLAFVDVSSIDDAQLSTLCRQLVKESADQYGAASRL